MRIEDLPTPGTIVNGMALRREACAAINASELYLSVDSRKQLAAFFIECAKKVAPPKPPKDAE